MRQGLGEGGQPLGQLQEILHLCVKCGRCRAVCPVFQAVEAEPAAARGKLAILEDLLRGGVRLGGRRLGEIMSLCLLCGRCTATCPNGAGAREAVELARFLLAQNRGLAWPKRLLSSFSCLEREARDPWLKGVTFLQRLLMKELPGERGLLLRLGGRALGELWAPRIKPPFFLEQHPQAVGSGEKRVGLFVGCTIHYLAPQVGEAALGILDRMGFQVLMPKGQGCCGLMAMGMGDKEKATFLARKVVEEFAVLELEALVVPCASCAFHLSKGIVQLLRGDPIASRAELLAGKVKELSLFLAEQEMGLGLPQGAGGSSPGGSVAYHDPCHLAVGLGIRAEPRKILGSLRSWIFKEMEGADECCGMGGTFRIFHPGVASRISGRKLQNLKKAQVDAVATSCMGCWMGLKEMLHKTENIQVKHISELVWEELQALQGSFPKAGGDPAETQGRSYS